MVRFTDKAREFWLEQSLDKGEMPKRSSPRTKTLAMCGFRPNFLPGLTGVVRMTNCTLTIGDNPPIPLADVFVTFDE